MLLAIVLAQAISLGNPRGPIFNQPSLMGNLTAFAAFPSSGRGTFGPCSATPPTGARGEALSYPGTGLKMCTKTAGASGGGFATTGILDGDLVALTSLPRVEYDTNGVLAYLEEIARTNSALRSQELDDVAYATCSGAVTRPSAGTTVAPDLTATAETLVLAAGGFNAWCQTVATAGAGVRVLTGFVKDISSSNGISFRMVGTGDATGDATCDAQPIATTSWTRVTCVSGVYAAPLTAISVRLFNSTTNSARNFNGYVWGLQLETGLYATSYVPTTSAAVTRGSELGAGWTLSPGIGPNGCIALSATFPSTATGSTELISLGTAGAGNNWAFYRISDTTAGFQIGATVQQPVVASMALTTHRWLMSDNGGTRTAFFDAVSKTPPAASLSGAQTALAFNNIVGLGQGSTLYSRIEVDPSPTRCTP